LLFHEKYSSPAHGEKDSPTILADFKLSPLSGGAHGLAAADHRFISTN
jgi:hypothetical protein